MTDNRVPMTDKELKYAKLEYFSTHYDSIIERLENARFWEYLFLTWNIRRMLKWAFPSYLYNYKVRLGVEFDATHQRDSSSGKLIRKYVAINATVYFHEKLVPSPLCAYEVKSMSIMTGIFGTEKVHLDDII